MHEMPLSSCYVCRRGDFRGMQYFLMLERADRRKQRAGVVHADLLGEL